MNKHLVQIVVVVAAVVIVAAVGVIISSVVVVVDIFCRINFHLLLIRLTFCKSFQIFEHLNTLLTFFYLD